MKKKKKIILFILPSLLVVVILLFLKEGEKESHELSFTVRKKPFEVRIYSSGELESENSENIKIPKKLQDRSLRVYQLAITDLIDEGTYVDSGDYVASLDHKTVEEAIKTAQDDLETALTEFEDAKIDSNLNLSNQRDEITNAELDRIETKIVVDESVYEAPSVKKKAEMDFEKANRKYEQEKKAYTLKRKQEENKVARSFIDYRQIKDRLSGLEELYDQLDIYSPKRGLLTYYKGGWNGTTKVGSNVSLWNPIIATIPDMNNLISRTFINEIDIAKVRVGMPVKIGIDAFPEKELSGEVTNVANIGQNMPNSDAKVFEVKIKIFDSDPELRPAMTTSNIIHSAV